MGLVFAAAAAGAVAGGGGVMIAVHLGRGVPASVGELQGSSFVRARACYLSMVCSRRVGCCNVCLRLTVPRLHALMSTACSIAWSRLETSCSCSDTIYDTWARLAQVGIPDLRM